MAFFAAFDVTVGWFIPRVAHFVIVSEMEMLRESRARDKIDGVDQKACIVDRNQFFNTQVDFSRELSQQNIARPMTQVGSLGGKMLFPKFVVLRHGLFHRHHYNRYSICLITRCPSRRAKVNSANSSHKQNGIQNHVERLYGTGMLISAHSTVLRYIIPGCCGRSRNHMATV